MFCVALVSAVCFPLSRYLAPSNLCAFYVLLVCWLAYHDGRGPAVLASALGAAIFDFCFVHPYFAFELSDREYIFTFLSLLGVSLLISNLTARAREQAQAALNREQETNALFEFSRALSDAKGEAEIGTLLSQRLAQRLGGTVLFQPAGDGPESGATYELLSRSGESLGRLVWSDTPRHPAETRLLETFARQTALALERERLAYRAQQAEIFDATEQLQTTLLNCISHDLRSPLVAIQGALESLQKDSANALPSQHRQLLLTNAIRETDRLNRFVANLMQMTRLESGHLLLRLEPQDLSEVVDGTLRILRQPARVKVDMPADLPLIRADFVLLQQALWNLLENALKFAPEGPIHIQAEVKGDSVQLSVRDHGPGIGLADQPLIFNRFYRGSGEVKGSGLGLPICRGLVNAMGGSVEVESAEPGARFRLTLPVADL